ncbi:hypothetical protein A2866_00610 [Candidatus Roizmanbacteria bacterium RIFCSPHIGHO2_01_FULL_39_8]|uniref:Thioredoxin-like fold domain-containing protein n=2 Tax=Candidatus Roizmaniibacteriota TaxID=1752723 RepID=A0A1F7GI58_9BACT|nr:MAG: hypothetical protein A2866_00610 [Candidatus Roizmanbacteria bacterium RIFCSPHIGHO2_01_FULL_39_8]OGK27618.1 MAG: hypothetical protein A3C28_04700 [Candidatus Roizmanbacteria bacterium RIFCSPHIGHO2_02_FULL_39_9]
MPKNVRPQKVKEDTEFGPKEEQYTSAPRYYSTPSQPSQLLIIILVVMSFLAGYLLAKVRSYEGNGAKVANQQTTDIQQQQVQQPTPVPISLDRIKKFFGDEYMHFGDANSKVLFVEVSDPSCPYCHVAGGQNPELAKQMGPTFQYDTDGGTYRPPVTEMRKLVDEGKASYVQIYANGHGNGELATQALYCAFEKGSYWEVHDKLMSNAGYTLINDQVQNNKANIPALVEFLADVTDSSNLQSCLESEKYKDNIARDSQDALSIGYQGTPHFIINTTIYGGAQNYSAMEGEVNKASGG